MTSSLATGNSYDAVVCDSTTVSKHYYVRRACKRSTFRPAGCFVIITVVAACIARLLEGDSWGVVRAESSLLRTLTTSPRDAPAPAGAPQAPWAHVSRRRRAKPFLGNRRPQEPSRPPSLGTAVAHSALEQLFPAPPGRAARGPASVKVVNDPSAASLGCSFVSRAALSPQLAPGASRTATLHPSSASLPPPPSRLYEIRGARALRRKPPCLRSRVLARRLCISRFSNLLRCCSPMTQDSASSSRPQQPPCSLDPPAASRAAEAAARPCARHVGALDPRGCAAWRCFWSSARSCTRRTSRCGSLTAPPRPPLPS